MIITGWLMKRAAGWRAGAAAGHQTADGRGDAQPNLGSTDGAEKVQSRWRAGRGVLAAGPRIRAVPARRRRPGRYLSRA